MIQQVPYLVMEIPKIQAVFVEKYLIKIFNRSSVGLAHPQAHIPDRFYEL
jgi:hypothetical protein